MRRLEAISQIALIAVCAIAGTVLVRDHLLRPRSRTEPRTLAGQKLSLPGVNWDARGAILLVISSRCRYCVESLPLYRRISELRSHSPARIRIVTVAADPPGQIRRFLAEQGVASDQVVSAAPGSIGVRGTPTVLVVDSHGRVRESFTGRLSPDAEARLLNLVARMKG